MKEITIVPLFDQSAPKIWDDFLHIRIAVMQHNYNITLSEQDKKNAISELKQWWKKPSQNLAFAAYDNGKMIGYINGTCNNNSAKFEHLYVLPQYQGQHIGHQLLMAAESAASINANYVELISLGNAYKFYEKYGYISIDKTNKYYKYLTNCGHCQTTPVFHSTPTLLKKFSQLSGMPKQSFNRAQMNKLRTPIFVYRDIKSNITGFGICGKKPEIYASSEWARSRIEKTITAYKMHTQKKLNKKIPTSGFFYLRCFLGIFHNFYWCLYSFDNIRINNDFCQIFFVWRIKHRLH